jgi:hypothetical protein
MDLVRKALQAQRPASKKAMQLIRAFSHLEAYQLLTKSQPLPVNTNIIACRIYPTPQLPFLALVMERADPIRSLLDGTATHGNLVYNPTVPPLAGAFKSTWFGHTNMSIFDSGNSQLSSRSASYPICIKQCHYANPGSRGRKLYGPADQLQRLATEVNCNRWAAALMMLVYDFMANSDADGRPVPFTVPQMRFVNTALAITDDDAKMCYMLEEVIPNEDGTFRKYINNNKSSPIVFKGQDQDRNEIALFLSFAQHVQYVRTQKMAFVSDFQGMQT